MSRLEEIQFARAGGVRLKRAGGRLAVYVPATRGLHVLNSTAELLFACLQEPATLDDLAAAFREATDGAAETIRADLADTLREFEQAGLVERRP